MTNGKKKTEWFELRYRANGWQANSMDYYCPWPIPGIQKSANSMHTGMAAAAVEQLIHRETTRHTRNY